MGACVTPCNAFTAGARCGLSALGALADRAGGAGGGLRSGHDQPPDPHRQQETAGDDDPDPLDDERLLLGHGDLRLPLERTKTPKILIFEREREPATACRGSRVEGGGASSAA